MLRVVLLCLVPAIGCGTVELSAPSGGAGTTGGLAGSISSSTSAASSSTTDEQTSGSSSGAGDETVGPPGSGFITDPDVPPPPCDLWTQDCPNGQKCVLVGDAESFNGVDCRPVVEDPQAAQEPCVVQDRATSGVDDCDAGSQCLTHGDALDGVCFALCVGGERNPHCEDAESACAIEISRTQFWCFPNCDPLLQDCSPGLGCVALPLVSWCVPVGDGQVADPCASSAACAPGLHCADASDTPGCVAPGCCSPYCDPAAADCPDGLTCLNHWGQVGACGG